ncbi:MAG: hypothetical protein L3K26_02845, partial [Candidatus Hydrogenedentes bacterium]|nr:hypothetical protein [Candidatus Hydrogenedentota bacterium]
MISTLALISKLIVHRHAGRWIVLLAFCLTIPSLFVGFATDDHNLRAVFQGYPGMEEVEQAPWDAFRFHFSEDAETRQTRMDRGLLPWWTGTETHTAFMRPLSSLSHWLDYALFGDVAWPMHLHSMLLFAGLLLLVGALYRNLMAPGVVAVLALLLYGIDDARGLPVGWLSARNSLLTAIFGILTLYCHDRFRRDGRAWGLPAGLAALCVGLLCGEAAVSIGGYLFAYALFMDPGKFRRGFLSLLPYGAVVVLWRIVYQHLGYGAYGSGAYVNPTDEPLLFLYRIAERLPLLFFGAFGLPDCTFYNFLPAPWNAVYYGVAVVFVAIVLCVLWPQLKSDSTSRFWLLGMTLSALPACLTSPQDRMLMFPALGGMALIATFFSRMLSQDNKRATLPRYQRMMATFWTGAHLVLAPVLLLVTSYMLAFLEDAGREAFQNLPQEDTIADETLVLVHTMNDLMGVGTPILRSSLRQPVPKHTYMLSAGNQAIAVERTDEHTLVLRPEGGYLLPTWAELFRSAELEPFAAGDTVGLDGLMVTVLEVQADGRPAAVQFRFDAPLGDEGLRWYFWGGRMFEPFQVPAIG